MIVSRDGRFHTRFAPLLRELGYSPLAASRLPDYPDLVPCAAHLIDFDSLGETEAACNALLALRERVPALRVILVSAGFARHDFSCARLPIGDVSLRDPAGLQALAEALQVSHENNGAWQERLAELEATRPEAVPVEHRRTVRNV